MSCSPPQGFHVIAGVRISIRSYTELSFTGRCNTLVVQPKSCSGQQAAEGLTACNSHHTICDSCHRAALHTKPKIWVPVGVCFSPSLPPSQHQWPSNSKDSIKTVDTRKQLLMHFQHCSVVNLGFLFNAVLWRKGQKVYLGEVLIFSLPFGSFKLGQFTKNSLAV